MSIVKQQRWTLPADFPAASVIIPRRVTVHVTFLKIGEINTLKEQFDADILVRCQWREPQLDGHKGGPDDIQWDKYWNPKIFIENAVGEPKLTSSKTVIINEHGCAYVTERKRFKGCYMETLELWEFPFDVQDLSITVMTDIPSTEVELLEDEEEIHKIYKQSFIDEQEWYLYKYLESEKREIAKDRADPSVRRSCLTVRCRAARRSAYFVWNIFSVTCLIAVLSFLTFAVKPDLVQNRLQLAFTLILTSVAFKFVVNQSLPRVSYLTYLDRYIFATMVNLACICIYHGVTSAIDDFQKKHDNIALCLFIGVYFIYNLQFFFRILLNPYRKRRDMKKAEQEYIKKVVQNQAARRRARGGKSDDSDSDEPGHETAPLTSMNDV